jgi:hypothetical protein
MSEILTRAVVDCSTGETTVIPLTEDEIAQVMLDRAAAEERHEKEQAEAEAKAAAKASAEAKLAALGLTAEEISAL